MTIQRPSATPTVQLDNDRVIVTRWDFPPGGETGWHRHEYDYVVVPMADGVLNLETPEGPKEAILSAGVSYTRSAGTEHNVINGGKEAFAFVEIELK
nr:cupin domain-containing protein [uncultured Halomonas sp.]